MFIWSSTTTLRTRLPLCGAGWPGILACIGTSRRRVPPGAIRWNGSSATLPTSVSAAACSQQRGGTARIDSARAIANRSHNGGNGFPEARSRANVRNGCSFQGPQEGQEDGSEGGQAKADVRLTFTDCPLYKQLFPEGLPKSLQVVVV